MTTARDSTLDFACELLRRPSVTPADEGCQSLIADRLDGCRIQRRTPAVR
jgi:acetylornithine deacetylase/succinyl-diaminopimelate desuccinylase-like protein